MSNSNYYSTFTTADFSALFPDFNERSHLMSDADVATVKTFLQVATGGDFTRVPVDRLALVHFVQPVDAVPLEIKAMPSHSFGQRLTEHAPIAGGDVSWNDLKLPKAVYERMESDVDFYRQATQLIWLFRKPLLLAELPNDRCMNCAANKATGFVTSFMPKFGDVANASQPKLLLFIMPAFPVCGELVCNARLRQFSDQFAHMGGVNLNRVGVSCRNCGKSGGAQMKKCGRCKAVFYCGRDCQLNDWSKHRVACRKLSKSELSTQT